jgi:transposase
MAMPLLGAIKPARRLIADKAYDADRLRDFLGRQSIEAVIPGRTARSVAHPLNRTAYRRRNIIERTFGWLKNWKRIATGYDRLAVNFLAAIALVATVTQWLG